MWVLRDNQGHRLHALGLRVGEMSDGLTRHVQGPLQETNHYTRGCNHLRFVDLAFFL